MRYRELLEYNMDGLEKYLNKNMYVSFRDMKKLKVPPLAEIDHMDPVGIYTYPLDLCWDLIKDDKLSFIDRTYVHIMKPTVEVTKFSKITENEFIQMENLIKKYIPKSKDNVYYKIISRIKSIMKYLYSYMPELKNIDDPQQMLDKAKWYLDNPENLVWIDFHGNEVPDERKNITIKGLTGEYNNAKDLMPKDKHITPTNEVLRDINEYIENIKNDNNAPGSNLWDLVIFSSEVIENSFGGTMNKISADLLIKMGYKIIEDDIGNKMGGKDGNEKYQAVFLTKDSYENIDVMLTSN